MKSKVFALMTILVLLATLASACGPTPTPAPTKPPEPAKPPEPTKPPAKLTEFHGAYPYKVPPEGHFNSYVTNGIPNGIGIYFDLLCSPLAIYKWADGTWFPQLATKWELVPPDKFIVTLRQGVKWSDGNTFTAKDVVATFNVGRLMKWAMFKYVDTITAKDDYTVEFHMSKPSTVVPRYVLRERIRDAATYGAIAKKVEDLVKAGKGADTDEWKAALKELTDFRPPKAIVSGPYEIDVKAITEAQLTMVKVPTAWNAKEVKFDKVVLYNGETPTVSPLVLAGDVDYATHGFPPATEKAFVDKGIRILRPPIFTGPAIFFNNDVYPLNKKEVRQAVAYAIKRDDNATVSLGASAKPQKNMAGFSDNFVSLWLSADDIKKLNPYDYDVKKAETLLTGIGFKKGADGIWVDDKGKKLEFELTVPAEYADWSAAAENAAGQLTKFGIKTTMRGVQFQQHGPEVNQGKFQMAIRSWGAAHPHPHFSYVQDFFVHNYVQAVEGKGMNFPMKQKLADGTEVDIEKLVVGSADGLDEAAQKKMIATVAMAFNELLPVVPLWERYGNNPALETRLTGWPPDADPIYRNSPYADSFTVLMILNGTLKPK
ncbi:MAG: ABC transporter substrate-binding protein [Chloroflexota bacterium]